MNDDLNELVAEKVAEWCKRYTVKELSYLLEADERTIKSWRAGNLPQTKHFIKMASLWGKPFIDSVYGPVVGFSHANVRERLISAVDELQIIARNIAKSPSMAAVFFAVICTFQPTTGDIVRPSRPLPVRIRMAND